MSIMFIGSLFTLLGVKDNQDIGPYRKWVIEKLARAGSWFAMMQIGYPIIKREKATHICYKKFLGPDWTPEWGGSKHHDLQSCYHVRWDCCAVPLLSSSDRPVNTCNLSNAWLVSCRNRFSIHKKIWKQLERAKSIRPEIDNRLSNESRGELRQVTTYFDIPRGSGY